MRGRRQVPELSAFIFWLCPCAYHWWKSGVDVARPDILACNVSVLCRLHECLLFDVHISSDVRYRRSPVPTAQRVEFEPGT